MKQKSVKPTFKSATKLSDTMFEIHESLSRIQENYPLHVGNTILHMSKLLLAKFIMFLEKYLKEDCFRLVYTGNFYYETNDVKFKRICLYLA